MRVAYDRDALYVAARAFDPHIDPLGARKFAQFFRVNPLGSRSPTGPTTKTRAKTTSRPTMNSRRGNLRAIWQTTSIRHEPALWLTPVSPSDTSDTISLVYGHRQLLHMTTYIGTNFARTTSASARSYQVEAFAKGSWTFDAL